MSVRLSNDGETWYEVDDARLEELLDDPAEPECLVSLLGMGEFTIPLSTLRKMRKQPPLEVDWKGRPTTLFGLPIVWSEDLK